MADNMTTIEAHPLLGIHYMIDRDGTLRASVPEGQVAHHVFGHSGRSIAVELINDGDGRDPYPEAQLTALVQLLRDVQTRRNIPRDGIKRHSDLDTGRMPCDPSRRRKSGPGGHLSARRGVGPRVPALTPFLSAKPLGLASTHPHTPAATSKKNGAFSGHVESPAAGVPFHHRHSTRQRRAVRAQGRRAAQLVVVQHRALRSWFDVGVGIGGVEQGLFCVQDACAAGGGGASASARVEGAASAARRAMSREGVRTSQARFNLRHREVRVERQHQRRHTRWRWALKSLVP